MDVTTQSLGLSHFGLLFERGVFIIPWTYHSLIHTYTFERLSRSSISDNIALRLGFMFPALFSI